MAQPPLRRERPADRALRALRRWIGDGQLPAGHELPAEAALAQRLALSRTSLRKALATLEAEGAIEQRPDGTRLVSHAVERGQRNAHGIVGVFTTIPTHFPQEGYRCTGSEIHVQNGVIEALLDAGYNSLLLAPERLRRDGLSAHLSDLLCGAVVLHGAADLPAVRGHFDDLRAEGVPVAVHADGLDLDGVDTVSADQAEGARQLTAWLLDHGCRRILRLWDCTRAEPPWLRLRNAGYVSAHAERGMDFLPAMRMEVGGHNRAAVTRDALSPWLAGGRRIDALMAITDGSACDLLTAVRDLGLRPNIDVAVVGYDHYWPDLLGAISTPCPPLATIDKQNLLTGRTLVEVLTERLAHPDRLEVVHRLVPPRLVFDPEQAARWNTRVSQG